MELFENELILPGVITEIISDYASGYDTSLFGTTDSVVIIGTAFNGPVGVPVEVYSPEHARYVFGDSYDSKTKREATLVSNIQDAWGRGCRTIYAVRVSGKEIYKDYDFAIDTNLKLRVSGIFPSNKNKELSMLMNIAEQNLFVKIFKPASRATIAEKNQGLVERRDSILVNTLDLTNMGLSLSSDLTELVNAVNKYAFNNVLRLNIVDENGNDVTISSTEAKGLKIKDLFSGLYTIGRAKTLGIPNTIVKAAINNEGELVKVLKLNSDVSAAYPIFAETKAELAAYLKRPMTSMFDFVTVPGAINEVFEQDKIDYEEVELSEFDLYKKLGSGYAINAQILEIKDGRYRVKEVEDSNVNKKTEIKDGIYSMLENLDAKYRVLAGIAADAKIKNRLPRKKDFEKVVSTEITALDGAIKFESVVDGEVAPKQFKIEFVADQIVLPEDIAENLVSDVARVVSVLNPEDLGKKVDYKEGSLFLGDNEGLNQLFIVREGRLESLHSNVQNALDGNFVIADGQLYVCENNSFVASTAQKLQVQESQTAYISAMLENGTFVIAKIGEVAQEEEEVHSTVEGEPVVKTRKRKAVKQAGVKVEILGTVSQIFAEGEKVITSFTEGYGENKMVICSPDFDVLTVEEVVEKLNEDADFSKLFKVEVNSYEVAQEVIDEIINSASDRIVTVEKDREVVVDVNKYIPYRTDDNFARHLAQHCMYTSLKTAPTHGIIGTKILLDTSLTSIANRVSELANLALESTLVAKKSNGTDMLDRNNMQYPIGRKVSVTFGQYIVTNDDGYSYVSNMAAGYAGMVSCLPLDQSSTSQAISIPTPMFELTNYQLGVLTQAGYVTTKKSYSKGYVITDGITMASSDSPFKRLSAARIADGIEGVIRSVCEPFIGKTNNLANQNSLTSAIKSELDKLKSVLIEDYDFRLITDKASNVLGILNIEYAIIPLYEIKQIRNHITVKQS